MDINRYADGNTNWLQTLCGLATQQILSETSSVILNEAVLQNADTTAIRDGIYPIVDKVFSSSSTMAKFKGVIKDSFEKRPNLYYPVPINRLQFGSEDENEMFKALKIQRSDLITELKKTFFWNMNYSPISAKDPFTVMMLMVVRHFVQSSSKDARKNAELAAIYLAFSGKMYPSAHYNSFPFIATDAEQIMLYVLNTQMNEKFDLKKTGTVFGAIRSLVCTWLDTYDGMFKSCTDDEVGYLLKQLNSRIKSFLKNFAELYYKSYKNKDYITFDSDNLSDDNFRLADNDSLKAERAVDKAINYMTYRGADMKLCIMCADQYVKANEIKDIIESVLHDKDNLIEMRELMSNMINDYFRHASDKDVRSIEFMSYSITAKPNAKDKNIVRIKEIIYDFLERSSSDYRRRKNRIATQNSYYKSILKYVTLCISQASK